MILEYFPAKMWAEWWTTALDCVFSTVKYPFGQISHSIVLSMCSSHSFMCKQRYVCVVRLSRKLPSVFFKIINDHFDIPQRQLMLRVSVSGLLYWEFINTTLLRENLSRKQVHFLLNPYLMQPAWVVCLCYCYSWPLLGLCDYFVFFTGCIYKQFHQTFMCFPGPRRPPSVLVSHDHWRAAPRSHRCSKT